MIDVIKKETQSLMEKIIEALKRDFSRVRTGRASFALLDGIRVDYYGVPTPLIQMASLSIPEPRLIVIQPWDNKSCDSIEKAILKSNLNLTPQNDGKLIRINIPIITSERRKELVRTVRKISEEAKIAVRNSRREANELFKNYKKKGEISEDDARRGQELVQKLTDEYIAKIDSFLVDKEREITEF